jgi:hypothetical protein
MGVAGTGGRQRLEAEALQVAGTADIPRIGNDEAAALVRRFSEIFILACLWRDSYLPDFFCPANWVAGGSAA